MPNERLGDGGIGVRFPVVEGRRPWHPSTRPSWHRPEGRRMAEAVTPSPPGSPDDVQEFRTSWVDASAYLLFILFLGFVAYKPLSAWIHGDEAWTRENGAGLFLSLILVTISLLIF